MDMDSLTAREIHDFALYLRNCTDKQVCGVYEKEKAADRDAYAELAQMEAWKRGITIE